MGENQVSIERESIELNPFGRAIAVAMLALGKAVELAMNAGNRPLLEEMRRVSEEIFDQAMRALRERVSNVH